MLITLTGRNLTQKLSTHFHPEIELDGVNEGGECSGGGYVCGLVEFGAINFELDWIEVKQGKNIFGFIVKRNGKDIMTRLNLDAGVYSLMNLGKLIQREVNRLVEVENMIKVSFSGTPYRRCIIEVTNSTAAAKNGFHIDFTEAESIGVQLGFEPKVYANGTRYEGNKVVKCDYHIDRVRINCDLVAESGSFHNMYPTHLLHEFHTAFALHIEGVSNNDTDYYYKMVEQPKNVIYLPVNRPRINSINVTLTDQNNNPIFTYDTEVELYCRIHIKKQQFCCCCCK